MARPCGSATQTGAGVRGYGAGVFELNGVEMVGYLASALVVLSLTMTSVVRLRMVSFCGSITFFVYGVLIDSVPIMITNGAIAVINVWFLRKEFASGQPNVAHPRRLTVPRRLHRLPPDRHPPIPTRFPRPGQ